MKLNCKNLHEIMCCVDEQNIKNSIAHMRHNGANLNESLRLKCTVTKNALTAVCDLFVLIIFTFRGGRKKCSIKGIWRGSFNSYQKNRLTNSIEVNIFVWNLFCFVNLPSFIMHAMNIIDHFVWIKNNLFWFWLNVCYYR